MSKVRITKLAKNVEIKILKFWLPEAFSIHLYYICAKFRHDPTKNIGVALFRKVQF